MPQFHVLRAQIPRRRGYRLLRNAHLVSVDIIAHLKVQLWPLDDVRQGITVLAVSQIQRSIIVCCALMDRTVPWAVNPLRTVLKDTIKMLSGARHVIYALQVIFVALAPFDHPFCAHLEDIALLAVGWVSTVQMELMASQRGFEIKRAALNVYRENIVITEK